MIREHFKEINSRILYKLVITDIFIRGTTLQQSELYINYEINITDNIIYELLINGDICYLFNFPFNVLSYKRSYLEGLKFFNIKPSLIKQEKYNITDFLIQKSYLYIPDLIFCDFCEKYLEPPYLYYNNEEFDQSYDL
jgi:hypothetical protein